MKTNPITNSSVLTSNKSNESSFITLPNKWDKCLDDYENYSTEYVKQYKKSLKGNIVSLCKYPYMKAKSEAICQKLNTAQNKAYLTEKQLERMSKIQIKTLYTCCS